MKPRQGPSANSDRRQRAMLTATGCSHALRQGAPACRQSVGAIVVNLLLTGWTGIRFARVGIYEAGCFI